MPLPAVDPGAMLAALPRDLPAVVVRDEHRTVVAAAPDRVVRATGTPALDALDALGSGWWAGWLAYDLGRAVEHVTPRLPDDLGLPDLALARFPARAVVDPGAGTTTVAGHGDGRRLLERAAGDAASGRVRPPRPPALGPWHSSLDEAAFRRRVHDVVELIRAGECYQVNLTRRLTAESRADPVDLYRVLATSNPAPHGAFVRLEDATVVSASPERFLRRAGGYAETRPIKGTARDPHTLMASAKDRAENVMIVDLARNDLGRVCEFGSVQVPALCALEAHPGLHHLVSTVRGRLRAGTTTGALVAATFPPASVTGAPKPRVLQAVEDLEACRRGVYCGAVGWIDAGAGTLDLNVAIRTFTFTGGWAHLGVGGGIVADSDPASEWDETELKAARLLEAAATGAFVGVS